MYTVLAVGLFLSVIHVEPRFQLFNAAQNCFFFQPTL
jgi:hypothetical protein